jgi:hypothetical protein
MQQQASQKLQPQSQPPQQQLSQPSSSQQQQISVQPLAAMQISQQPLIPNVPPSSMQQPQPRPQQQQQALVSQQQAGNVRTGPLAPLVYGGVGGGSQASYGLLGGYYYQPHLEGDGLVDRLEEIAFLHQETEAAALDHEIDR